jgi:tRNA threonylcarbamoyladenosine biosynthesis protein TsaE
LKLTYQLSELKEISKKIISQFNTPKTLLFYGEMGVGKTTLIKELVKQLGVLDITSSPTFSIVNEYKGKKHSVFHFDFYRITNEEEVYDIGIEDYFYQNAWCFIEWPEQIPNILPEDSIVIILKKNLDETRIIEICNS